MASSLIVSAPTSSSLHYSSISRPKTAINKHVTSISQLGCTHIDQWNGLKYHFSISISQVNTVKKRRVKGKGVYASLFGVGAPEALVIGVVALLVFGPKGLAEAARNIGQALRGIQPTIRELQEVSRDFKTSLEREIGLDEMDYPSPRSSTYNKTVTPAIKDTPEDNVFPENLTAAVSSADNSVSEVGAYSADDYLKFTEAQLKAALARAEEEKAESESETSSQDTPEEGSLVILPSSQNPGNNSVQESDAASGMPQPEAAES